VGGTVRAAITAYVVVGGWAGGVCGWGGGGGPLKIWLGRGVWSGWVCASGGVNLLLCGKRVFFDAGAPFSGGLGWISREGMFVGNARFLPPVREGVCVYRQPPHSSLRLLPPCPPPLFFVTHLLPNQVGFVGNIASTLRLRQAGLGVFCAKRSVRANRTSNSPPHPHPTPSHLGPPPHANAQPHSQHPC